MKISTFVICCALFTSGQWVTEVAAQPSQAALLFQPGEHLNPVAHGHHVTYKYEGNLISRKFHQPNCPYSLLMSRSRKVYLPTIKSARAQGYKACRWCLAAASRTVHACLIQAVDGHEHENSTSDMHHDISR